MCRWNQSLCESSSNNCVKFHDSTVPLIQYTELKGGPCGKTCAVGTSPCVTPFIPPPCSQNPHATIVSNSRIPRFLSYGSSHNMVSLTEPYNGLVSTKISLFPSFPFPFPSLVHITFRCHSTCSWSNISLICNFNSPELGLLSKPLQLGSRGFHEGHMLLIRHANKAGTVAESGTWEKQWQLQRHTYTRPPTRLFALSALFIQDIPIRVIKTIFLR